MGPEFNLCCRFNSTFLRDLLDVTGVPLNDVSEVILGQVLAAGQGQNPARQVWNMLINLLINDTRNTYVNIFYYLDWLMDWWIDELINWWINK